MSITMSLLKTLYFMFELEQYTGWLHAAVVVVEQGKTNKATVCKHFVVNIIYDIGHAVIRIQVRFPAL